MEAAAASESVADAVGSEQIRMLPEMPPPPEMTSFQDVTAYLNVVRDHLNEMSKSLGAMRKIDTNVGVKESLSFAYNGYDNGVRVTFFTRHEMPDDINKRWKAANYDVSRDVTLRMWFETNKPHAPQPC